MPLLKRVLLTGAFGRLGRHLLKELLGRGYSVRCFARPSRQARRVARSFQRRLDLSWGDIRDPVDVERAVTGTDAVIHAASISYPGSERDPAESEAVTVGGTRNLIDAVQRKSPQAQIVFASSYLVHPYEADRGRLLRVTDEVSAPLHFAQHMVEAEHLIRHSGLSYTILRVSSVLPDHVITPARLPLMFRIPLDQRLELVHPSDAAVAFANALARPAARGRTFFVGGGRHCQTTCRGFHRDSLGVLGLVLPPDEAFSQEAFAGDWLDSTDSQAVLTFQKRSLTAWLKTKRPVRPLYWATRLLSKPLVSVMLRYSQPWQQHRLAANATGAAPPVAAE